jgi:hypothetical protein
VGGAHNANVSFVYRMILAWRICTPLFIPAYIAANLFGIILFSLHDGSPDEYSSDYMSEATKYSFVTNWINAFVLQWILMYVPYHW